MKRISPLLYAAVFAFLTPAYTLGGELANIKVVTDANPDYSDMESMVRSITHNWKTDAEKMYALFYWDHIARRQTSPMIIHGAELTDPIRQYNDYGFTMCSTISGIKCSTWNYMGYPCRLFDIGLHTVPDVWYEGRFHHYDNSLSVMYTLEDGVTIAGVDDVGKTLAGPETGGKPIPGYLAMYHCLNGTSPDGYIEGGDTERTLQHLGQGSFQPKILKYRFYYYGQERGHRYTLNLRDGESYTRYYARQDANSPNAILQDAKKPSYKADPAYYVPNGETDDGKPRDPETANPRYHIRGNGDRTWTPILDAVHLDGEACSIDNITSLGNSLVRALPGKPATAIFKVEGANVIASLKIHGLITTTTNDDIAAVEISTNNGLQWKPLWQAARLGQNPIDLMLVDEVNGAYDVLVKITLISGSRLDSLTFDTITEINAHTQPQLKLGANTVYVGAGEQTQSIVLWPELQKDRYKACAVEETNIASAEKNPGYMGCLYQAREGEPAYVVFKVDAPTDITSFTYGGRLYNRAPKAHIDYAHSFDGGKTWTQDYSLTDTKPPWDVIHYETIRDVPPDTRSVLFKYTMNSNAGKAGTDACSIYDVRMEVNHQLSASSSEPLEVTFNWSERQNDYSLVKRSHSQLVDHLPMTYTINVGGDDQPIVDSLTVNLKGSRPDALVLGPQYGYSDGKDVGGTKWVGNWATYGKNLALGKPYTISVPLPPKEKVWGGCDPDGHKLTDGRVGSNYTGGVNMKEGVFFTPNQNPEITVDLGSVQKCAAFRIHTLGYEFWDAIKGENQDKVELLVSEDGATFRSVGCFDFNLHWKDLPVNFMYPDDETLCAYNFMLRPTAPVEARFVKYKVTSKRFFGTSEIQVLDSFKFTPFDLRIALPDPSTNGKAPPKPDVSPHAKGWDPNELPTVNFGKQTRFGEPTPASP